MTCKVYLAGGWFTPSQDERYTFVENSLRDLGFDLFVPRSVKLPDNPTQADMDRIFMMDIDEIDSCDFMFNITNEKDMGTLFEAGYAWSHNVPIVYFAEGLDGPFNLMLAKTASMVLTSRDQISQLGDQTVIDNIIGYKIQDYVGGVE